MSEIIDLSIWSDDWSLSRFQNLLESNSNKHIRVLGCEEYNLLGNEDKTTMYNIKHIIEQGTNKVEFLTGSFPNNDIEFPSDNVRYCTKFWPAYTFKHLEAVQHKADNTSFTKTFVSLNNKPWDHRCQMMDQLARFDLIKQGAISWNEPTDDPNHNFKYWKQQRLIIDEEYANTKAQYHSFPKTYFKSFLALVAESTMECMFPTEKTYTPIYFKKPFIVWSIPNFHKQLTTLGFELYTEIIDYSFDSIANDSDRLEQIVKQVELLSKTNHRKMYDMVAKKAQRNYNILKDIAMDSFSIPVGYKEIS